MKHLALQIPGPSGGTINITGAGGMPTGGAFTLANIISVFLSLLVLVAVVLCLLYLVWGGFNWITSEGDKQRLESARQKVIYAVLGLIVVIGAFVVINIIYQFFFKHNAFGI